jgi:hypothetical protein
MPVPPSNYLGSRLNQTGLSDDAWLKMQQHYGGWANDERWREAISQAARGAGFQHKIIDLQSFVDHLMTCCRS